MQSKTEQLLKHVINIYLAQRERLRDCKLPLATMNRIFIKNYKTSSPSNNCQQINDIFILSANVDNVTPRWLHSFPRFTDKHVKQVETVFYFSSTQSWTHQNFKPKPKRIFNNASLLQRFKETLNFPFTSLKKQMFRWFTVHF